MADEVEVVAGDAAPVKQLSKREAQSITKKIRDAAEVIPELLLEAYEGQAHKSLGYETWEEYVQAEFRGMTRMSAWRNIQQAKAARVLTEVAGAPVEVTQREAIAFAKQPDAVVERVREAVSQAPEDQRTEAIRSAIEGVAPARNSRVTSSGGDAVRPSVPQWLKPVWPDVERAAASLGSNPFDFVLKTLSGAISDMALPPVETPEKPARKTRARQSAGRAADGQEGDRDAAEAVPGADPFAPSV